MIRSLVVFDKTSPYAALAEILTSRKIGLSHVRLVGEVVVAQSRLNEWLATSGKASLSPDAWVALAEQVLECEDRYKAAWAQLAAVTSPFSRSERLQALEQALHDAVRTFESLREGRGLS